MLCFGKTERFPNTNGKVNSIEVFHKNTPESHNLNEKKKKKKKENVIALLY